MAQKNANDIIEVCGKIAKILLENGAETTRVESTVEYIGRAAGIQLKCHATMTAIFVNVKNAAGSLTHLEKPRVSSFNLQKVDEINTLSREFSSHRIGFDQLQSRVEAIDHQVIDFSWPQKILSAGLVSVAPMLLFKASWKDLLLAFFIGILGYLASQLAGRHSATLFLGAITGGLVISLIATSLKQVGIADSSSNIVISALMPLVPGVPLTNSLREIIDRDIISGLVRGMDALMIAGSIGIGAIVGTFLANLLIGVL